VQAKTFSIFNDMVGVLDKRVTRILKSGCYRWPQGVHAWIPAFAGMTMVLWGRLA
jgi:hypothetical protein